ncbi:hypothetical protein M0802_001466 [Mischocyttarus mexicanus]|nr:hypothetical protein M0802_001466 [Mischocyttarus mexicanus]
MVKKGEEGEEEEEEGSRITGRYFTSASRGIVFVKGPGAASSRGQEENEPTPGGLEFARRPLGLDEDEDDDDDDDDDDDQDLLFVERKGKDKEEDER